MTHIIEKLWNLDRTLKVKSDRMFEFMVIMRQEAEKINPLVHEILMLLGRFSDRGLKRIIGMTPKDVEKQFKILHDNIIKRWKNGIPLTEEEIDNYTEKMEKQDGKSKETDNIVEKLYCIPQDLEIGYKDFDELSNLMRTEAERIDPRISFLIMSLLTTDKFMRRSLSQSLSPDLMEKCKKYYKIIVEKFKPKKREVINAKDMKIIWE